jgi:hypothetical protein
LQNDLPSGRPDVVFLANDLNSDLGRSCGLFREKSALIFLRTSRDRAVEAHCPVEGTAMDRFGGPPINRTARGGVDPIPLHLPPSLSLSRVRRSNLATAFLPRPSVQPPAPAKHVLAPPLRAVILLRTCVKPCATLDPTSTLAVKWRRRELPSRTRRRHGAGRR